MNRRGHLFFFPAVHIYIAFVIAGGEESGMTLMIPDLSQLLARVDGRAERKERNIIVVA